jgi:hypothetical protein
MLYSMLDESNQFADFRAWRSSSEYFAQQSPVCMPAAVKRSAGWDGPLLAAPYPYHLGLGSGATERKNVAFPVVLIYTGAVFWIAASWQRSRGARWSKSSIALSAEKAM